MKYKKIAPEYVPSPLLLEADPSEENIQSYLRKSQCFVAEDDEGNPVGVMVMLTHSQSLVELMNASVLPTCHGRGIGSHLLAFALRELKSSGVKRVELGTGCFWLSTQVLSMPRFPCGYGIERSFSHPLLRADF